MRVSSGPRSTCDEPLWSIPARRSARRRSSHAHFFLLFAACRKYNHVRTVALFGNHISSLFGFIYCSRKCWPQGTTPSLMTYRARWIDVVVPSRWCACRLKASNGSLHSTVCNFFGRCSVWRKILGLGMVCAEPNLDDSSVVSVKNSPAQAPSLWVWCARVRTGEKGIEKKSRCEHECQECFFRRTEWKTSRPGGGTQVHICCRHHSIHSAGPRLRRVAMSNGNSRQTNLPRASAAGSS